MTEKLPFRMKNLKLCSVALILSLATTIASAQEMVSVAGSVLNLRSGPGAEHPILYELKANFPLKVVREQDKWIEVLDFEGDKGWVFKAHTHPVPAVIVSNEYANLREGPGTQHPQIAKADYGDVFRVLDAKSNSRWVQILRPNGTKAWIAKGLVWGL